MVTQPNVLANLRTWLESGGAYVGAVRVSSSPSNPVNRHLEATTSLRAGTPFLRIPPSHLITDQSARAAPHVRAVLDATAAAGLQDRLPDVTSDSAAILLFVLAELVRGPSSKFYPWLSTLPESVATPLTQPGDVVSGLLSGSPVLPLVETLRTELIELYTDWFLPFAAAKHPDSFPRDVCTPKLFAHAHSIVESRAFQIDTRTLLAPFADMCNHAPRASPTCTARARGWATDDAPNALGLELLVADGVDIEAGTELCISYGAMPNWQLLVHYGFAMRRSTDDSIAISLERPGDDPTEDPALILRRLLVLRAALGVDPDAGGLDFVMTHAQPLPREMLRVARVLLMDSDEIAGNGAKRDFDKMVTPRNERAVVDRLRSMVHALLQEMDDKDDDGFEEVPGADRGFMGFCRTYIDGTLEILRAASGSLEVMEAYADEAAATIAAAS